MMVFRHGVIHFGFRPSLPLNGSKPGSKCDQSRKAERTSKSDPAHLGVPGRVFCCWVVGLVVRCGGLRGSPIPPTTHRSSPQGSPRRLRGPSRPLCRASSQTLTTGRCSPRGRASAGWSGQAPPAARSRRGTPMTAKVLGSWVVLGDMGVLGLLGV